MSMNTFSIFMYMWDRWRAQNSLGGRGGGGPKFVYPEMANMPIKHFSFHKSDHIAIKYSELSFDTDSA